MRAPFLCRLALFPFAAALSCALAGCPTDEGGGCDGPVACAAPDAPPCATCPPLAVELCVEGDCVARAADAVDVTGDVRIDRNLDGVAGLVHVLVSGSGADGSVSCADAAGTTTPASLNVLAAGQKSLSGGDFHSDLGLGRVPEGPVVLLLFATDEAAGGGSVIGVGCQDGLDAVGAAFDVGVVDVDAAP